MSTSTTGFILKEGTDVFEFSRKVRNLFLPKLKISIAEEMLAEIIFAYDKVTYNDRCYEEYVKSRDVLNFQDITLGRIYNDVKNLIAKNKKEFPYHYQIRLGFMNDPLTKRILCHFSGSQEMENQFEELDEVSDYSYWDSSEHPDNVTAEEWAARSDAWDRSFLPSGHVPTSVLGSQVISDSEAYFWWSDLLNGYALPTMEARQHSLITHLITLDVVDAYLKEGEENNFNTMWSALNKSLRDKELYASWKHKVDGKLETLDHEDLMNLYLNETSLSPNMTLGTDDTADIIVSNAFTVAYDE